MTHLDSKWGWYRVLYWSDHVTRIAIAVVRYGLDPDQFDAFVPPALAAVATFVGDDANDLAATVDRAIEVMREFSPLERHAFYLSGHGTFEWREPMATHLEGRTGEHFHQLLAFAAGTPEKRFKEGGAS